MLNRGSLPIIAIALLGVFLAGCATNSVVPRPASKQKVSLMTFNVGALFEHKKEGRNNKRNGNSLSGRNLRLENLAKTILQIGNGQGPDILVLQGIENQNILEKFRKEYLLRSQYIPTFLPNEERKGTHLALLSRLPLLGKPILHQVEGLADLLEADISLIDGRKLTLFVVYVWPALSITNGTKQDTVGPIFNSLNRLAENFSYDRLIMVAGDFSFFGQDKDGDQLLETVIGPRWTVAHKISCPGCLGTKYDTNRGEWSFSDLIFLSKNLLKNRACQEEWFLDIFATRVVNDYYQQKNLDGTPKCYNPATGEGVSDHWPLYVEIKRN